MKGRGAEEERFQEVKWRLTKKEKNGDNSQLRAKVDGRKNGGRASERGRNKNSVWLRRSGDLCVHSL